MASELDRILEIDESSPTQQLASESHMQCTGRECFICGGTIVAEIEATGCTACNIAVHDNCIEDPSVCPSCKKSFAETEKEARQAQEKAKTAGGFFGPEKKGVGMGVAGGLLMIAIAAIWFFGGLAAGYVFFYPPILFAIGVYALLKGLITGNLAGNK
jgi:predicted Zn-ribbon and HTH transcriptional regulator